jgi:hypothetical protein
VGFPSYLGWGLPPFLRCCAISLTIANIKCRGQNFVLSPKKCKYISIQNKKTAVFQAVTVVGTFKGAKRREKTIFFDFFQSIAITPKK